MQKGQSEAVNYRRKDNKGKKGEKGKQWSTKHCTGNQQLTKTKTKY